MHTVTQLRLSMPDLATNIRRSRCLTKAAVIATDPEAGRTLVVTSAVARDEDYHLVHMFDCRPGALMDAFPHHHNILELRPERWCDLLQVVRAFLAGASEDQLCELASGPVPVPWLL